MNKKTQKALEESIDEKWIPIAEGKEVDEGTNDCPLCKLFYYQHCKGCPIFEHTGKIHCVGTPYQKWTNHQMKVHWHPFTLLKVRCKICARHAWEQVDFLRSLLPK